MNDMTETVQTRLTPEQKQSAVAAARNMGLSLAAFIRVAVLSKSKEGGQS